MQTPTATHKCIKKWSGCLDDGLKPRKVLIYPPDLMFSFVEHYTITCQQ